MNVTITEKAGRWSFSLQTERFHVSSEKQVPILIERLALNDSEKSFGGGAFAALSKVLFRHFDFFQPKLRRPLIFSRVVMQQIIGNLGVGKADILMEVCFSDRCPVDGGQDFQGRFRDRMVQAFKKDEKSDLSIVPVGILIACDHADPLVH